MGIGDQLVDHSPAHRGATLLRPGPGVLGHERHGRGLLVAGEGMD